MVGDVARSTVRHPRFVFLSQAALRSNVEPDGILDILFPQRAFDPLEMAQELVEIRVIAVTLELQPRLAIRPAAQYHQSFLEI